ncbi:hypothetical protein BLA60_39330 [Actinophytocola xinjiangensis]|uniref:Methyltransferase family protein n=1 Tax=Actinophytocola xinjiangensis TaxID=485602 RepID=A0A7Z0WGC7_9PSEU|nr:class I SAM-dependent methyltransferase [Actinophytocola xinjiangensis]OLF04787.1 hypothetical protein BLA60_39330 [Actinophytocola xinjiangensis]
MRLTGTDFSPAVLEHARPRAAELGREIDLREAMLGDYQTRRPLPLSLCACEQTDSRPPPNCTRSKNPMSRPYRGAYLSHFARNRSPLSALPIV